MGDLKIPIEIDNYQPLREVVFEALRDAIVSRILEPGERLMEVQLAEAMGVSRTPVREAIRRLELEGFVVMIPRRGAYVAQLSLKDIADAFEIRGALEGLAAGLAAERATEDDIEELGRLLVRMSECLDSGDTKKAVDMDIEFHEKLYDATATSACLRWSAASASRFCASGLSRCLIQGASSKRCRSTLRSLRDS